jgi:selenocysteine-specific elongation factor
MEKIVGTAGHIDHGKTALVKALTGVDTDRLPEEKRRGITVDLGFAEMTVGDTHFGFVDVPGHERFVRNMLAGASGIDIVLLVIAADEGVMPQTREHFDICRLLDIEAGLVVLTKSDIVDAETIDLARLDIAELVAGTFLEHAPVIAVSSRTGDGVDEIADALAHIASALNVRDDDLVARLPIDRSFSVKGFGTVVTGTLASGELGEESRLELMPHGVPVRIRGLQTHGSSTKRARAGQRTAVNLGGIDHEAIVRGMTLVEAGSLRPTQMIDAEVEVLASAAKPLRSRQRVRVHLGTAELLARVQVLNYASEIVQGKKGFVQVRLESPAVAVPGERLIIRSYSPQATIAGGVVINALAEKHRRREFESVRIELEKMRDSPSDPSALVKVLIDAAGNGGLGFSDIQARTGFRKEVIESALKGLSSQIVNAGGHCVSVSAFDDLRSSALKAVTDFHRTEPLSKGMSREALRDKVFAFIPDEIFKAVVSGLESDRTVVADKETVRLASHQSELAPQESAFRDRLLAIYNNAKLDVPRLDEALKQATREQKLDPQKRVKLLQAFVDAGELVKVSEEFYFAGPVVKGLVETLKQYADTTSDRLIDVPKFKDLAGVSRKYAIPLLEYFDRVDVTRRVGDKRVVTK